MAPVSLVFLSRAQQEAIDEACIDVWGTLDPRPSDDPKKPEFDEALAARWRSFLAKMADPTEHGNRLFVAMGNLDQLQKIDTDVRKGLEAILRGMVTATWTAFEVMASDLWEAALNAKPAGLAELKGKVPVTMNTQKKRFTAFATSSEEVNDFSKLVRLDYLQSHGYDLSGRMGTILRERYNFQILEGIRTAYVQAFDDSHSAIRDAILDPCLTALAATRNVLVHRAGTADRAFMQEYARCANLQSAFPTVELGATITLTGLTVHGLIQPVLMQSVRLIEEINKQQGTDHG